MRRTCGSLMKGRAAEVPDAARFAISNAHVSRMARAAFAALAMCFAAASAMGQAPPILNSPYVCANGITYTVTVCKPFGADQWCETDEKQNGNLVTGMNSAWSSMTGRLKGCTNSGNANAKPGNAPAAPAQPSTAPQQAYNPPYLKEFPTVDQIKAQLQGTSVQDTAYRQMSALREFGQMIAALAGPRMSQNQLTADEVRILTGYFNAYSQIAQATANPQDAYLDKPDFTASLFSTFKMPTIQQLWQTANSTAATGQGGARPLPPTNDPSQIAIRRCFELGGSGLQCVGAGMGVGLKQMIGLDPGALTGPGKSGLTILGTFNASSGLAINFNSGNVDISNCGKMVQGAHNYSVGVSSGKYVINISNQPQAFEVTLGPDGQAAGPAAEDITGQQVTGYEVTTNLKTGAEVGRTPIFGPITVHCSMGNLKPGPNVTEDPGFSSGGGVLSALGTVMGMMAGDSGSSQLTFPPGPRMTGVFAGASGLKIQFNDGNAVIDCAQAHVLALYNVSLQANGAVIAIKSTGTTPFTLAVQSDGSLAGSGSVTVNGKLMTALDENANPVFAPTSATCSLASLAPAR